MSQAKQPIEPNGTIIAGRYRIDKAIARGGCSIVYRGTHIEMQRQVALKLMSATSGQLDPSWVERFKREAQLACQLNHAYTITIFDYGVFQNGLYIAMEWLDGDSLRNVIKRDGAMSAERVARLGMHMLESLFEAHQLNILHRDLKPSNLMLMSPEGQPEYVKVLDFGLAKATTPDYLSKEALALTRDGDFVGTPRYASPEQLRGQTLSFASDIYGVGMVLWEMLSGHPAIQQVDFATCVQVHLGPQPWVLPPSAQCPLGLSKIVERMLIKDQLARYQSCDEVLNELRAWLGSDKDPRDVFETKGFSPRAPMPDSMAQGIAYPTPPQRPNRDSAAHQVLSHASTPAMQSSPKPVKLELETINPPRPRQRRAVIEPRVPQSPTNLNRWIIVALCVILLVIGFGVWRSFDTQQASSVEGDVVAENRAPNNTAASSEAPLIPSADVIQLIKILRKGKWNIKGDVEVSNLGRRRQTSMRLTKGAVGADVLVYEYERQEDADAVATVLRDGAAIVRPRADFVVKIYPSLKNDQMTISQIKAAVEVLSPHHIAPDRR